MGRGGPQRQNCSFLLDAHVAVVVTAASLVKPPAACAVHQTRHTVVEQPPASDVSMDLSVAATRWARWTSCGTRCGTSTAASCRCGVPTFGTHMLTAPWHNKCPCEGSISTLVHKSGPRRPHDADVVRLAAHTAMHAFASAADLRQARLNPGKPELQTLDPGCMAITWRYMG